MGEIESLLSAAGKVAQLAKTAKSGSLIEYSKVARVEPVCGVDSRLLTLTYLHDCLQAVNSMMAGYYLQGVQLDMNVGSVDVRKMLDKFNPDRGAPSPYLRVLGDGSGVDIGIEDAVRLHQAASYDFKLPTSQDIVSTESYKSAISGRQRIASMEVNYNSITGKVTDMPLVHDERTESTLTGSELGKDTISRIEGGANLSVGMMLDVHVESNGCKATIPVLIRLAIAQMDSNIIVNVLGSAEKNTSFKERWHGWRSGELDGIKDLILCQDLIDAHRTTLMKDTSGVYAEILARRQGNRMRALFSGDPSIADASNIWVISEETAKMLESRIGGRLNNFTIRERVFQNTYAMLLVVIDPTYEAVTIYSRSIHMPTQISVKELKSISKSKGPDVAEILKAYSLGSAPKF